MTSPWAWIIGFYGLQIIAVLVLLWLSWQYFDRRYRRKRDSGNESMREPGFRPTAEVFIDPKDGKTYRVYYNDKTGEREYIEE